MPDGNMDVGSNNHNSSNASDGGDAPKHVCGLCWTSFSSPTELQQHCLECFSEDYSVSRESEEEESPSPEKAKDSEAPTAAMEVADDAADCENSPSREDSPSTSSLPDGKTLHLCKLCPKTFTNYGSYRRHLRMHSCGHRYTCDICGKQFFRRYLWIKHYEKIHNSMMQNMCQCTVCEMWLKNSDTLKEHIRTKHRFATGATSDVDLVGDSASAAKTPVETIVLDSLSLQPIKEGADSSPADSGDAGSAKSLNGMKHQWMCNLCSEVFGTKAQLMKHKEDKHGRKRVWAPKAPTPTPEADDAKRMRIEEVAKEVFHGMLSEFSLQGMLSSEAQKVKKETKTADLAAAPAFSPTFPGTGLCDPTKRGVFLCEVCKKTFINRSSYLRHKKMHTGVRPYTCEHCCMSFFRSESLTTHKKKHLSGDQFKCFVCGHIAEGASDLSSHFLSSHSKLPEEYDKNTIVRSRRGRPSKYTMLPQLMGQTPSQQSADETMLCVKKLELGNQDCDATSDDTVLVGLNGDADSLNSAADKYTCLVCFQFFPDEQSYYDHQCKDDLSAVSKAIEQGKDSSSQDGKDDGLAGMPRTFLALEACALCSAKFPTKKHLQEHMIVHICRYCGHCFKETSMLSKHIDSIHKELVQAQSHTCCCCDLTLEDGNALVEHVLDKHSSMLPSFDISVQKKPGLHDVDPANKKSLEEFVSSIQSGADNQLCEVDKQPYRCGWCKECFPEVQQMVTHFRDVHNIINIAGDAVNSIYTPHSELRHGTTTKDCLKCCQPLIDSVHICSDKSVCNLCLRTFDDPQNAHAHQELSHLLVDWFCCDACDACGPRDVMEKHVLSHMSKVGNLVVPETPSEAHVPPVGNTEPFQKVREAFLNWCRNGTSKNAEGKHNTSLSNGESVPAEKRVKTRSEILIEEAKKGFPTRTSHLGHSQEDASVNGEMKHHLSKDIIELLPKNGEITMIPIKLEATEPFSQLRSALTTAKKHNLPSTFDRNGNILKTLLGERRSPLGYSDYPWEKDGSAVVSKHDGCEADEQAVASDPGLPEREPKGSPASDQAGSSSNVVLKCDDCKRLFTHYSSWKRHRRQHLGISTHTCGECQRTFYRKDQYDKHLQSHHHKNGAEA